MGAGVGYEIEISRALRVTNFEDEIPVSWGEL